MQTTFSLAQLADADVRESNDILRTCVHCGFCIATCPTYLLLGDELDSPRGRIYLIKDMLERDRPPSASVVTHIDRCLSCLSCMTTCPSGVNYMHLVDYARRRIETDYRRPLGERLLRALLGLVLPRAGLFRAALRIARPARPLRKLLPGRLGAALAMVPARTEPLGAPLCPQVFTATGPRKSRAVLLAGCVQQVLAPAINRATLSLLARQGCEVVLAEGAGCCGALAHHLGHEAAALAAVRANVAAWSRELERAPVDAVIVNASGCGTMVKDYGFLLRNDPVWAEKAARISELARDVTEFLDDAVPGRSGRPERIRVAYHSACSMQHGQGLHETPKRLLRAAGFQVLDIPEGHICCGSAGTYNILQPGLAGDLRARKLENIARVAPDAVATGNIGCMVQLAGGAGVPVLHTVELLDWAEGGPRPAGLDVPAAD